MTICGCRSPLCSMIVRRTWPEGSVSTFMVSPSTMSSKRTLPPTSARIGMLCGSHSQSIWPRLICWPSSTIIAAPSGTSYFSSSRPLASRIWISPLRDRAICLPSSLIDDVDADELDLALALALDVLLLDAAGGHAADVEGAHGELGARLADRLGGDDAHGHAHLDELAGGQVHAVAAAADAQRRLAGHRAADLDLLDLHLLELPGRGQGDHLVFADDHLVGDRVDDVDPADPAADRLGQADLDLLALVDDALGDALRGAAVFHRDDDVLGDVGELAGQVAASRPS